MERLSYKDKLILIITAILVLVLLICAVIFWDDFYRFFEIITQGSGNVGKYVRDLGYIGVLLLGGSIFIIYLIPVLSSVVFQMTAGLAYGVLLGTVLVGISIGLGSQLVYLFYRNYKILMVIFGIMYGLISYNYGYYGETITYVGMTVPMAVLATISWLRHPHQGEKHQVSISHLTKRQLVILPIATVAVTIAFYYILGAFNTASLYISTLSITTSFVAVYLSYCRSPYYAVAYASNDVVLIVLWIIASIDNLSNMSMLVCFCLFLVNDIYGYINWRRLHKQQQA